MATLAREPQQQLIFVVPQRITKIYSGHKSVGTGLSSDIMTDCYAVIIILLFGNILNCLCFLKQQLCSS